MKRLLLIVATLLGVLVMHGGVGTSGCSQLSMAASMTITGTSDMSARHTPTLPQPTHNDHQQAGCVSPLPPSAIAASQPRPDHGGVVLGTAGQLVSAPRLARPSGREPPRLRQLDPTDALGVLRT